MELVPMWLPIFTPWRLPDATQATASALRSVDERHMLSPVVPLTAGTSDNTANAEKVDAVQRAPARARAQVQFTH